MLIYRLLPTMNKTAMKIVHSVIQVLSLIVSAVGLKAVFDSVNLNNSDAANLVSLHSWLGMATVILFCIQVMSNINSVNSLKCERITKHVKDILVNSSPTG